MGKPSQGSVDALMSECNDLKKDTEAQSQQSRTVEACGEISIASVYTPHYQSLYGGVCSLVNRETLLEQITIGCPSGHHH